MIRPDLPEFTRIFGRIGVLAFGGPAAQIALMHRELVEQRGWLSEQGFLRALGLCMLLPGPEAMQLATYAGWRLRGTWGGLLAGLLFVLPGAVVIAVLALLYAVYGQLPPVQAAFVGIKAAVIVVVLQALTKVAGKALVGAEGAVLATLSFVALFVFGLPFPLIIVMAGLWGALRAGSAPAMTADPAQPMQSSGARPLRVIFLWGALWAAPLVAVWLLDAAFLLEVGLFFSKLAMVTFGGAYAVLGYMTQTVVTDLGWITTEQMIDALGLAETTPGPLILVTQFVAMLAGFVQGGPTNAFAAGLVALWVTFCPCFLWIFLAGPFLDRISTQPRLSAALTAITAAVVGVILNLSLWFALHVMFAEVGRRAPIALPLPVWHSFDPVATLLIAVAAILMLRFNLGFVKSMIILAFAALALG
ncbi:chromate efflux transporter [uncultured Sulfitobacter sp.]|uniref:chromate efflux transporter n=1 Tax=uncultured Sulfitobacter sp. TaxID=191468 RepID=UPI00262D88DC|nr:chromate efflux transporter [uncultured Sulfitobacter sp.]